MNHTELSICDFGAVSGAEGLQTAAFQGAIDAAWHQGGGTVVVPGGSYTIGSIRLRSHVTLKFLSGARVYASRNPEDYDCLERDTLEPLPEAWRTDRCWEPFVEGVQRSYAFMKPGGRWSNGLIRAVGAENIAILAEADVVIDGRDCFDELGEEGYRGPHGISMQHCRNICLSGYTMCNTGNWSHCITDCRNIHVEGIRVLGGHDGVHFTSCTGVYVENCEFYTGDDCIAGFGNLNTFVKGCICNTACSGLRYGGTNALIRDCKFFGPAQYFFRGSLSDEEKRMGAKANRPHRVNMLSVFTYFSDFSIDIPEEPGNIVIENCTVENVDRFLHYNYSGNERWQSNRPLSGVRFQNIQATGIGMPLTAYGSPDAPLELVMKDMTIAFREGVEQTAFMHAAHFASITLENITVEKPGDAPLIRSWTPKENIHIRNVDCPCTQTFEFTREPFVCTAI